MLASMKKHPIALTALFFIAAACAPLFAQEEALKADEPRDLKVVSLGFAMNNLSASSAGLRASLDLERFLSLGVLWDMGFTVEGERPATELAVGLWTDAKLLSEENGLPVSFTIRGEFLKMRSLSAYLDENRLVKSGTGYLIGASLSRRFKISEKSALDVAADGWYRFDTYTLEAEAGSEATLETQITPSTDYFYGVVFDYELTVAEKMAISFGIRLHLNSGLHVFYGPGFSFITW